MIELRYDNPVVLKVTNIPGELIIGDEEKDSIKSQHGAVFSEDHYGFCLSTLEKGKIAYPTQCPIFGVEVVNGVLRILEDGKFTPWSIDVKTGEILECAKFLNISRRDIRYLKDHFGLGLEDMDRVNSYLGEARLKKTIQ